MNPTGEAKARESRGANGPLDPASRQLTRAALMRHIAVFAAVNAILLILNLTGGADGLHWAYLITLGWAVVLAVHVLAYLGIGRSLEDRAYTQNYRDIGRHWGGI